MIVTIGLVFLAFCIISECFQYIIEQRKIEREKARFQYVRRKRPARRRRAVA